MTYVTKYILFYFLFCAILIIVNGGLTRADPPHRGQGGYYVYVLQRLRPFGFFEPFRLFPWWMGVCLLLCLLWRWQGVWYRSELWRFRLALYVYMTYFYLRIFILRQFTCSIIKPESEYKNFEFHYTTFFIIIM